MSDPTDVNVKKALNAHLWQRDPLDFYCEPHWTSQRLFAVEKFDGVICDPACGSGRILESAVSAGYEVVGTDIKKRLASGNPEKSWCVHEVSFFDVKHAHNIVSNPPFGIAQDFVAHALEITERKVAMLLPITWLTGKKRSTWLAKQPLYRVYILAPRPSMPPGRVIEAGIAPGGGKEDFCWLVFLRGYEEKPTLGWLRRDDDIIRSSDGKEERDDGGREAGRAKASRPASIIQLAV